MTNSKLWRDRGARRVRSPRIVKLESVDGDCGEGGWLGLEEGRWGERGQLRCEPLLRCGRNRAANRATTVPVELPPPMTAPYYSAAPTSVW